VAGRQSGAPFDSLPPRARCILAHNNTGRAWAIIRLDPDATETDDLHERITRWPGCPLSGSPVAVRLGEGSLSEPTAATQPWLRADRLHASGAKLS
jgi:hypothetical protein